MTNGVAQNQLAFQSVNAYVFSTMARQMFNHDRFLCDGLIFIYDHYQNNGERKMAVSVANKHEITYEEYLTLPEIVQRYEIVDGEMIMSPAPTTRHQAVLGNFYRALFDFVTRRRLGFVLLAPLDVIVRRKPKLRTRQPDLIYVSTEWQHIIADQIEGGPDLVVEILSPGDTRKKIAKKLKDYCRIGVRECWLVSIEAETVEVLRLSTKNIKRIGLYGIGDLIRSKVLSGLALPTKKLFV